MDQLHLITASETAETRIHASGADLMICISGQSFFTGSEAFRKAAEVRSCVEAMKDCGIRQDDISIQNVSTEVESGILTKSSSATYHLAVCCRSLECLGPALAVIAARKNAKLAELLWSYHALEKTQNDLLQTAVRKVKGTAQSIAESLGTHCCAVHRLSYDVRGLNRRGYGADLSSYDGVKRRRASASPLQQLNLEHTTQLTVAVTAEFVAAPFQNAG